MLREERGHFKLGLRREVGVTELTEEGLLRSALRICIVVGLVWGGEVLTSRRKQKSRNVSFKIP